MFILSYIPQNGMWQIRGLLRESPGENFAKRRKRDETLKDGSTIDTDEESVSSFSAARHTGSLSEWHVSGREFRR